MRRKAWVALDAEIRFPWISVRVLFLPRPDTKNVNRITLNTFVQCISFVQSVFMNMIINLLFKTLSE